jgi:uncharacterized membrane-anchored protein
LTRQEQIERLTQQLLGCGYHLHQIKQIINEAIENAATEAGRSQEELVIEALEGYLEFGMKCKMKRTREQ